uniref:Uncharacterized protein n=1 Tax=Lepeophtheirus salmonis TaxID=72036 RepID=A0A0K2UTS7_LEPSM
MADRKPGQLSCSSPMHSLS